MNSMRPIMVFAVIGMSLGLSTAQAESKTESKADIEVEDNFKVSWTRISYNKTVSIRSTFDPNDQKQEVSERLSLDCEVDILDPNLVLGTSRSLVIEEMIDDKGEEIAVDPDSSRSSRMSYEAPRYDRKFVAPTRPPKWKSAVRSALKLPPTEGSQPQWIEEVRPSRMGIGLDIDLNERAGGEISSAKGYFYALVADSIEYVDVPFRKSDKWVRLTPEVEVKVLEAWSKDSSYRIRTEARPQGGSSIRGSLSPETYLPTRLVMGRQLIGSDDKPTRRRRSPFLPFHVGGGSSGGGGFKGDITKMRYEIAVNPTHYEIPFVLENIPLPKP